MKPETLKIVLIVSVVVIVVGISLTLGLVFGLKKDTEPTPAPAPEPEVEIVNLYNNTAELLEEFPVDYSTKVNSKIEEHIQNRLLTGFKNWNLGFAAWKKWGDILYTPDSIYNVHGARLSLASYQRSMDDTLKVTKIDMGKFHNMLINDNFCGIYYDIITTIGGRKVPGTVMEFVNFKEYRSDEDPDTRVVEGWGSTKSKNYDNMKRYQDEKEKKEEDELTNKLMDYTLPETSDLKEKYNITYKTTYIDENADQLMDIILKGFEAWNNGTTYYSNWIDENLDSDAKYYYLNLTALSKEQYKEEMQPITDEDEITRLCFDNLLIRDNWAGLHYRYRKENRATKEKYVGDRMQFIKFEQKEGTNSWKIVSSWIK